MNHTRRLAMLQRHILSVVALLGLVFLAAGSLDDDEEKDEEVEKAEATVSVTAKELHDAYEANEVAADDEYKDKVIEVAGTVTGISKNPITDEMYLELGTSNQFMDVHAYFSDKHGDELKSTSKGQDVKLKCKCKGKTMNVKLENCTFAE